jgi:hypothetical protein
VAISVQTFGGVCKQGLLTVAGNCMMDPKVGLTEVYNEPVEPLNMAMYAFGSNGAPVELQSL